MSNVDQLLLGFARLHLLLGDRREYDKEDLAKAYPYLTNDEVEELYKRLQYIGK